MGTNYGSEFLHGLMPDAASGGNGVDFQLAGFSLDIGRRSQRHDADQK